MGLRRSTRATITGVLVCSLAAICSAARAQTPPTAPTAATVAVVSTCPADGPLPGDIGVLIAAQGRVDQNTRTQIQAYTETHPEFFGSLRFGGENRGTLIVSDVEPTRKDHPWRS